MLKSVFNVFRTALLLGAPVVCLTRVLMLSCIFSMLLAVRSLCLRSYRCKSLSSFSLIFKNWFWSTFDGIKFNGPWIYQRIVLAKSLRSKRQERMPFFGVRVIGSNLAPNYTFFQADSYTLLLGQAQSLCNSYNTCSLFSYQIFCNIPLASKCLSKWRYDLNTDHDETGDFLICGFAESVRAHPK